MYDNQSGAAEMLDPALMNQLSIRLRQARRLKKLTLNVLALRAGCSESLLSKIENGKAHPSLPMLARILDILDVSISWVFNQTNAQIPLISKKSNRHTPTDPKGKNSSSIESLIRCPDQGMLFSRIIPVPVQSMVDICEAVVSFDTAYIIAGSVSLLTGGNIYELRKEDAFSLRATHPYTLYNDGPDVADVILTSVVERDGITDSRVGPPAEQHCRKSDMKTCEMAVAFERQREAFHLSTR